MKIYQRLLLLIFLSFLLQSLAGQEKFVVAGSSNPYISIIDKKTGTVEWEHKLGEGEECNSVSVTKQGNILYSYKKGAKLIDIKHHVIWDYKVPDDVELQSASYLKDGGFLLGVCGNPALLIELDKNGRVRNQIKVDLQTPNPHAQFRQVNQLRNKNYLLPVLSKKKIMEINREGKIISEFPVKAGAFSSLELKNKNWLLSCGDAHLFLIIDPKTGKEIKRVASDDIEGVSLSFVAQIFETEKGNLLICNWDGHIKDKEVAERSPQLIEIDKNNKVVWSLTDKKNIGKVSAICVVKDSAFSKKLNEG